MSARPDPPDGPLWAATLPTATMTDRAFLGRLCVYLDDLRRGVEPAETACQQGRAFHRAIGPFLRDVAARTLSPAECANCAQQVWLLVIRRLYRFRTDGGNLYGWLTVLTRRAAVDLSRRRAKERGAALAERDEGALPTRDQDPADAYERRRTCRRVHETLDQLALRLSPLTARVVRLRWIEGESVSQIAAETGLTEAQIHDRQLRARRVFREIWETCHDEISYFP